MQLFYPYRQMYVYGILVYFLVLSGCLGVIGTPIPTMIPNSHSPSTPPSQQPPANQGTTSPPSNQGPPHSPTNPKTAPMCQIKAIPRLRRLTREEYRYSIQDILSISIDAQKLFPPDEETFGFAVGEGVSLNLSNAYMKAAESITAKIQLEKLADLFCTEAQGNDTCAQSFLINFGRRLYRRPLTKEELQRSFQLYKTLQTKFGFRIGILGSIQFFLQTPQFLYRLEEGQNNTTDKNRYLRGHELATRLAYFLWKSIPDDTLLQAAKKGKLSSRSDIEVQVRRMLLSPKSKRTIHSFFEQWLELEKLHTAHKNTKLYPSFNPQLIADLKAETMAFIDHLMQKENANFKLLFTAPYRFLNERLSNHYQLGGIKGPNLRLVSSPGGPQAGIFTHGSLLSIHALSDQSSPIHRGVFVRQKILCHILSPPPPNLMVTPPDPDPNLSTRDRFEAHRKEASCSGCHRLIDPIGFGFEHFDAVGRYRKKDGKFDIDASGELVATEDANGTFVGVQQLASKLANSNQVHTCFTRQWFRYAYGREETPDDQCVIESATQDFRNANYDIRELMVSIATHKFFTLLEGDIAQKQP